MDRRTIVYGYIEGARCGSAERNQRMRLLNETALASLPIEDDSPMLVRSMLSISSGEPGASPLDHIIHFGCSLRSQESEWSRWRIKFEALLRRLCWESAKVHLVNERWEPYTYSWLASEDEIRRLQNAEQPAPVQDWVAVGGPRGHRPRSTG